MRKAIIFGISSDIGNGIAERLRKDSWTVVGTSTNPQKNGTVRLDLTKSDDIEALFANTSFLQDWSLLCFFSATMNPIGPFFSSDFLEWRKAFEINVFSQLQILHKIWDFRSSSSVPSVCFLAGGGTNSSFDNYSAYCLSKITLIKFVELIASENEDANFFIIGPGYMRTKIHNETLRAGELAGKNYSRTIDFLQDEGTTMDRLYEHIRWCIESSRFSISGRNFSTVNDPWDTDTKLLDLLAADSNLFKLRRSNKFDT